MTDQSGSRIRRVDRYRSHLGIQWGEVPGSFQLRRSDASGLSATGLQPFHCRPAAGISEIRMVTTDIQRRWIVTVLDTRAPSKVEQETASRPWLAWLMASIIVAALVIAAMAISVGENVETAGLARGDVLEELVELGYLPDQALETEDIYTHRERATIDAVSRGLIPRQTLDEDTFVLKGIIDRLVPSDS